MKIAKANESEVAFREVAGHATVSAALVGPHGARQGIAVIRDAIERARALGWCRILIDIRRAQVVTPLIRGYESFKRLAELTSMQPHERLAVVFDPATYDAGRAEVLEMASANWGNPPARAFVDVETALGGLKSSAVEE